jgi:excisionase family DNA binding protein
MKFLTTPEVSEILRVPAETLRFWRHAGKGPKSCRFGRRVVYSEADVHAWVTEQQRMAG